MEKDHQRKTDTGVCFQIPTVTLLRLTGSDRQSWLHNFCTADIKALEPGQGCEAFILNVKGRTIAHAVIVMSKYDLTVVSIGEPDLNLADHCNKYIINEDVVVEDIGENHRLWYGFGKKLNSMFDRSFKDARLYSHALVRDRTVAITTKICGQEDWLLIVNKTEDLEKWYGGLEKLESNEFHTKRFFSRFPINGIDVTLDHLPQEFCRDKEAISFTKGCYLGQETVARIDAIGHVNYFFVNLQFESDVEAAGIKLVRDEKQVGNITSSVGKQALGFVRKVFAKQDEVFETETGKAKIMM